MTLEAVEFDVEEFRELIEARGEEILVERGSVCPCQDSIAGTHNRSCETCNGTGIAYSSAVSGQALVRQVDERKEFARFGQLYVGDITVTTMPDTLPIGENDRITLTSRHLRRSEVLAHSGEFDALKWAPAVRLLGVRSDAQEYTVDDDVVLSETGSALRWVLPEEDWPTVGTRLGVAYMWTPRYIVVPAMITTRRTVDGVEMPQRVVARLLGREDLE